MVSNFSITKQSLNVNIADILSKLQKVRKTSKGWIACCPAHNDRSPSLSISVGTGGRILFHCFAGCSYQDIVHALGYEPQVLNPYKPYRPLTQKEKEEINRQAKERALKEAFEKWANDSYLKLATFRRALFKSLAEPDDYFKNPEYIHELLYVDHLLDILSSGSLEEKRALLNLYLEERLGIAGGWLR